MPTSLYKTAPTDGLHSTTGNQQIIESSVNSYPIVITTLGHFSIYKYGQLINTHGNSQHKPSELLKLVIALGSRSVGEVRINDALWPDADGDVAHTSFSVTLHRIRKFLTMESMRLLDSHLSINDKECWVDVWALNKLMNEINTLSHYKKFDFIKLNRLANTVLQLYQGHFLGNEDEQPWFIAFREKQKARFVRCLSQICDLFEQNGHCELAIDYYRKGIEIDQLSEGFYQRLMKCYMQHGRYIEAVAVYQQCQRVCTALTGFGPSAATNKIYQKLARAAA